MKISLMCLVCLFSLFACNNQPTADCSQGTTKLQSESDEGLTQKTVCPAPDEGDDDVVVLPPGDSAVEGEVPLIAGQFNASVSFTNFTSADIDKVQEALVLIRSIVKSEKFRERVLKHTYLGVFQFANNNGLTNEQIYQTLLAGSEELKPEKDNEMDLVLELYANYSTSTVGYTYANALKIWMNRKYFDRYVPAEVARNIFHEWTHKLGFVHDSNSTSKRPYSVPYALGSIIEDMALAI